MECRVVGMRQAVKMQSSNVRDHSRFRRTAVRFIFSAVFLHNRNGMGIVLFNIHRLENVC